MDVREGGRRGRCTKWAALGLSTSDLDVSDVMRGTTTTCLASGPQDLIKLHKPGSTRPRAARCLGV